jgi:hypothetical protein
MLSSHLAENSIRPTSEAAISRNVFCDVPVRDRSVEKLTQREIDMGLGKGALLWLVGIPLPIIILLMLFWR